MNILGISLFDMVRQFEKEYQRTLTEREKEIFMEGFNYACLVSLRNQHPNT